MQSELKAQVRYKKLLDYARRKDVSETSLGFASLGSWPIVVAFVGLLGLIVANIVLAAQKTARQNRNQIEIYFIFILIFCVLASFGFVISILNLQKLISFVQDEASIANSGLQIRNAEQEAQKQAKTEIKDESQSNYLARLQAQAAQAGNAEQEAQKQAQSNYLARLQAQAAQAGTTPPLINPFKNPTSTPGNPFTNPTSTPKNPFPNP